MPVSMWMAAPAGISVDLAEGVPFGELAEIADHRPAIQFGEGRAGAREKAVEHIDRRGGRRCAGAPRLVQGGDEECLAACGGEGVGDRLDAAAIGVRLHDAGAFGRHAAAFQLAPVGDDGVEIDGEHTVRGRVERARLAGGRLTVRY